ncbi:site-specific integrase [Oscillospiraceae bacterium 44-34]
MTIKTRNPGIYQTLIAQLDKTARHNRQGSFRTKERYYEAMQRFCKFLSEEYRLQKLVNINGKHLTAYVLYMQERGKSASTIKTDLAAIRFFHDKMERTKYRLPSNNELAVELERRRFGGVDRTWSVREFHRFLAICMADGHEDFAAIACLTWYAGLRVHECFRIETATAEQALRENAITIKGKGGKVRTVPINESISIELKKLLAVTSRGHKLFVPDGVPTDAAIARFQQYIYTVRPQIQDGASTRPLTHHGLRHSYAARTYQELIDSGMNSLNASLRVSQFLGHERPNVTRGYLASIPKDGADGK